MNICCTIIIMDFNTILLYMIFVSLESRKNQLVVRGHFPANENVTYDLFFVMSTYLSV